MIRQQIKILSSAKNKVTRNGESHTVPSNLRPFMGNWNGTARDLPPNQPNYNHSTEHAWVITNENSKERMCNQCPRNTKEDEFHFLCEKYKCTSKKLFSKCQNDNQLFQLYSDPCKFIWLLTTENMKTLNHLGGLYYKRI